MKLKFYKGERGMGLDIYRPVNENKSGIWIRSVFSPEQVQWTIQRDLAVDRPAKGTEIKVLDLVGEGTAYIEITRDEAGFADKVYPFSWEQEVAPCTQQKSNE